MVKIISLIEINHRKKVKKGGTTRSRLEFVVSHCVTCFDEKQLFLSRLSSHKFCGVSILHHPSGVVGKDTKQRWRLGKSFPFSSHHLQEKLEEKSTSGREWNGEKTVQTNQRRVEPYSFMKCSKKSAHPTHREAEERARSSIVGTSSKAPFLGHFWIRWSRSSLGMLKRYAWMGAQERKEERKRSRASVGF